MVHSVIADLKSPDLKNIKVAELPEAPIAAGQVRIRNKHVGINRYDQIAALGAHPVLNEQGVLGFEAVGEVLEVAPDVSRLKEGDLVLSATSPIGGALAESMVISANHVMPAPSDLDPKTLATCAFKAMFAHSLVTRTYIIQEGLPIVIHDAASALGQFLCTWARGFKALVIGTVADDSEKELAEESGCHIVYNYNDPEWGKQILDKTEGYGVAAIYDSVGKAALKQSLLALGKMGILIMYDSTSGAVESIPNKILRAKSLFLTVPSLFHYKVNPNELVLSAEQVFHAIKNDVVRPKLLKEIALDAAPQAIAGIYSEYKSGSVIVNI